MSRRKYLHTIFENKSSKIESYLTTDNQPIVIKKYKDDENGINASTLIEMSVLQSLKQHKHIVQLLGIENKIHDNDKISTQLILSHHKTDLNNFIINTNTEDRILYFNSVISQLFRALYILKQYGIIHADIKPNNILVDYEPDGCPQCYIADFGISHYEVLYTCDTSTIYTVNYRPPEICLESAILCYASDIWALGITMLEFIINNHVFNFTEGSTTNNEILNSIFAIVEDQYLDVNYILKKYLNDFQYSSIGIDNIKLLCSMLHVEPNKRPCIETLVDCITNILPIKTLKRGPLLGYPLIKVNVYYKCIQWMISIGTLFKFNFRTIVLCIDIFDRFLANLHILSITELQKICCACISISAKLYEYILPVVHDYISITNNLFSVQEFIGMELYIVKKFNYLMVSSDVEVYIKYLQHLQDPIYVMRNIYNQLKLNKIYACELSYNNLIHYYNPPTAQLLYNSFPSAATLYVD